MILPLGQMTSTEEKKKGGRYTVHLLLIGSGCSLVFPMKNKPSI
jgi:hypothetical protein